MSCSSVHISKIELHSSQTQICGDFPRDLLLGGELLFWLDEKEKEKAPLANAHCFQPSSNQCNVFITWWIGYYDDSIHFLTGKAYSVNDIQSEIRLNQYKKFSHDIGKYLRYVKLCNNKSCIFLYLLLSRLKGFCNPFFIANCTSNVS